MTRQTSTLFMFEQFWRLNSSNLGDKSQIFNVTFLSTNCNLMPTHHTHTHEYEICGAQYNPQIAGQKVN